MDNNVLEINTAIEALSLLNSESPSKKITDAITKLETTLNEVSATTKKVNQDEVPVVNTEPNELSYIPVSQTCKGLETLVPAKQRYEMLRAMETLNRKVGGVDEYVADRLGYINSKCDINQYKEGMQCLCNAFSAEQVDAIAMAIYNIEERKQGCIIGDQTGIGKGRICAGIIQYAVKQGRLPIFFTEKPNLFSDIYRDLIAINADAGIPQLIVDKSNITIRTIKASKKDIQEKILSDIEEGEFDLDGLTPDLVKSDKSAMDRAIEEYRELYFEDKVEEVVSSYRNKNYESDIQGKERIVPFIINSKSNKTNILDEDNNVIYYGQDNATRTNAFESGIVPNGYDVVLTTYSQFGKASNKYSFLNSIANGAIIIMDESHNASGTSNVGAFLRGVLELSEGCVFASATFAKRPDNMPLYAAKTCIKDSALEDKDLIFAIQKGGVALQEILSSQLTAEGQMLRRERSYEGISVNYCYLDESQIENGRPDLNLKTKHRALADSITDILSRVILFQQEYVDPFIRTLARRAKKQKSGGVDNTPAFNGLFQVINQLLFSIKAETSAKLAVESIKRGEKPIIAFSSTMESFLNYLENEDGTTVGTGDTVQDDFSLIIERRLKNVLRYKVTSVEGTGIYEYINLSDDLGTIAEAKYYEIYNELKNAITGVSLFPIDVIKNYIWDAGYKVNEITGRSRDLKLNGDGTAIIQNRKVKPVKEAFNEFNNNEVDCLLINITGATGASAHAVPTKSVPPDKVKPRHMIILQAELDINKEVQKRGRIFRTGQIYPPKYTYVISAIPAEERYMMMLQKKLKSLDANTSSNQKNSSKVLSVIDFLNKYGDAITVKFLAQNPEIIKKIDDPLGMLDGESVKSEFLGDKIIVPEGSAHKVSGRIAILKTEEQESFYESITTSYIKEIEYLNSVGENDLEVEYINYEAEPLSRHIAIAGNGSDSPFGGEAYVEHCLVNNLKKPFDKVTVDAIINTALTIDGVEYTPEEANKKLIESLNEWRTERELRIIEHIDSTRTKLIEKFKESATYKKSDEQDELLRNREFEIESDLERKRNSMESSDIQYYNIAYNRFRFFYIGRVVASRVGDKYNYGVFTGYKFGNASNKFAHSNIDLTFQFASSKRGVKIPLSKMEDIFFIEEASKTVDSRMQDYWYSDWNTHCKEYTGDKIYANIVTGNIILSYKLEQYAKGKLIEYTLADGSRTKGILLGEQSEKSTLKQADNRINIPLSRLDLNRSTGLKLKGDDDFFIKKEQGDKFSIRIGGRKEDYNPIIQNPVLLRLSIQKTFSKIGGLFGASYDEESWNEVVGELTKMNVSAILTLEQAQQLGFKANEKQGIREPLVGHIKEVVEGEYSGEEPKTVVDSISHLISPTQYIFLKENIAISTTEINRILELDIPKMFSGSKDIVYLRYTSPEATYLVTELSGQNGFGYKNDEYGKLSLEEILKDSVLDISFSAPSRYRAASNTSEQIKGVDIKPLEGGLLSLDEFKHSQKGFQLYVVKMAKNVERDEYVKLNTLAKKHNGYYSGFNKGGAIAGFLFKKKEEALSMLNEYSNG